MLPFPNILFKCLLEIATHSVRLIQMYGETMRDNKLVSNHIPSSYLFSNSMLMLRLIFAFFRLTFYFFYLFPFFVWSTNFSFLSPSLIPHTICCIVY